MIAAVVLAAGQSRRMGRPKLNLPWGKTTVLGQILSALSQTQVEPVVIVTGDVPPLFQPEWQTMALEWVKNQNPAGLDMLGSLQIGLASLSPSVEAAFVVLGDQPQIRPQTLSQLLQVYVQEHPPIVVPSYQMRRGHPWLLRRELFEEIQKLQPPATLRDFLNRRADEIHYVALDSATILMDLDTPQDYEQQKPLF